MRVRFTGSFSNSDLILTLEHGTVTEYIVLDEGRTVATRDDSCNCWRLGPDLQHYPHLEVMI